MRSVHWFTIYSFLLKNQCLIGVTCVTKYYLFYWAIIWPLQNYTTFFQAIGKPTIPNPHNYKHNTITINIVFSCNLKFRSKIQLILKFAQIHRQLPIRKFTITIIDTYVAQIRVRVLDACTYLGFKSFSF